MEKTKATAKAPSSRLNLPTRSSIVFTLSGIASKGASLLLTPIFTRLLSPSEYGTYSLFNSYLSVLTVLATLEIGGSVVLRAFQRYRGREYTVILTASLIIFPTAILVLLGFAILRRASGGGSIFFGAYPMLFISVVSSGIINLVTARAKFLYKPKIAVFLSLITGVAAPVLAIFLISADAPFSYSRVVIKVASTSLALLLCTVCLAWRIASRARRELSSLTVGERYALIKECAFLLLRLSLPLLPYYFSVMAISQADKLAVSRYLGASALGGYSVAYSTGLAPICISQGLICALTPWVMRKVRSGNFQAVRKALGSVFSILCALSALFLAVVPEAFAFLAPAEYRAALPVTFIIALSPLPLFLMNIESSVICAYERTLPTVLTGAAVSVLSVCTTYLLTSRLGYVASAACVISAYVTVATVQAINIRRITGHTIADPKLCLRAFLLTATLSLGMLALRESLGARLTLALLPLASLIYMLSKARELLRDK